MTRFLCSLLWSSVIMFAMILCWIGLIGIEVLWWGINILNWADLFDPFCRMDSGITPRVWAATPLCMGLFGLDGVLKV